MCPRKQTSKGGFDKFPFINAYCRISSFDPFSPTRPPMRCMHTASLKFLDLGFLTCLPYNPPPCLFPHGHHSSSFATKLAQFKPLYMPQHPAYLPSLIPRPLSSFGQHHSLYFYNLGGYSHSYTTLVSIPICYAPTSVWR